MAYRSLVVPWHAKFGYVIHGYSEDLQDPKFFQQLYSRLGHLVLMSRSGQRNVMSSKRTKMKKLLSRALWADQDIYLAQGRHSLVAITTERVKEHILKPSTRQEAGENEHRR